MKKKKTSFAKFSDVRRKKPVGRTRVYAKGLSTHKRRVQKIKEVAGDCWWVEVYLMDRCNIVKTVKPKRWNE